MLDIDAKLNLYDSLLAIVLPTAAFAMPVAILVLTGSLRPRMLTLGLFTYVSQFGVDIPALLASVVLSGIPVFAVHLVARRALVGGLMGVGGK